MILAFDTYYFENEAKTACLAFATWNTNSDYTIYSETTYNAAPYTSGEFYKRELPCILSLFRKMKAEFPECIIIDGYVFLNDEYKPGLGKYLFQSLIEKTPVIGVAKTNFAPLKRNRRLVFRGKSKRPLYITAIGIDLDDAASLIQQMAGNFRIPDLLKILDKVTREKNSPDALFS